MTKEAISDSYVDLLALVRAAMVRALATEMDRVAYIGRPNATDFPDEPYGLLSQHADAPFASVQFSGAATLDDDISNAIRALRIANHLLKKGAS